MIKHPQLGAFCHTPTLIWLFLLVKFRQAVYLVKMLIDERRGGGGADDTRWPLIASVCVSCMNRTCSRVRIAPRDSALFQWMVQILRASQVFGGKYSRTYRPLCVLLLSVLLDPSLPQYFSFLFCIAGKTWTTAPFFSLAITVFSRFAVDNEAEQCCQCYGCSHRATGMLTLSRNYNNTAIVKCLRCY